MKVYTLKAGENWFCDRYQQEWSRFASEYETNDILNCDLIWLLPSWQWARLPDSLLREKKVIATVHHVVPNKFNKELFLARDRYVDAYHVPCVQTKKNILQFTKKPIKVIGYWLNEEVWHPMDRDQSRRSLNIPMEDFVVGSFQRDTEGSDLKSPKLEKGPDLFVEYVKNISKPNLHILLGGWRRQYIINKLQSENIKYTYIELAERYVLKKMYSSLDLYVVSSRYEGGPQALLEASAMRVPIVSTDVGMATDVLCKNCIIDINNSEPYFPSNSDVNECYNGAHKYEIKEHINKYIKFFKETL
jgi:glycosyltransferase involved in cell wall biosynthesis